MLNFTVGPVMSPQYVLDVSAQDAPYFRTPEFSQVMLENERRMLELLSAPEGSRCVFLTASGTGAMETAVMGVLRPAERVVVINGGSFGARFVELCELHGHEVDVIAPDFGRQVTREQLEEAASKGATALLINMHETSSGILYDMAAVAGVCKSHGMLLIVDAVSAFIADPIDMEQLGADVVLTGSQKALACHPGVSVMALSPRAQERVHEVPEICRYLSLKEALANGERGQTPWTPAVTTLLEISERLKAISERGIEAERADMARKAAEVRSVASEIGLRLVAENPSNAVSAFWCDRHNAKEIIRVAKDDYGMWLCPNGGSMADDVFRIGHIGAISDEDNKTLLDALRSMHDRGVI